VTEDTEKRGADPARLRHKVSHKVSGGRRSRRKKGQGSVIHRRDGRWVARLQLPDGTVRVWYCRSQDEAEGELKKALDTLGQGLPLPDDRLTVGAWLEEWVATLPAKLKPATIDFYSRYVKAHLLRSDMAKKPLVKLEAADLERLYRRMTASPAQGGMGLSSTSAHHLHAVVHRALGKAVRQGKVARNVAELVDEDARPAVARTEMHVLADAKYDRFLEAVRGERLEALFVLAIREGLRQGEILGLRWRDVDPERGTLSVTGSLQGARRSTVTIGEPKSRHSRRSLALFPETVEALHAHRARQVQERLRAGSMWVEHDLVFPNEFGAFLSTTTLTRALDGLLRRAELPDVRFHDLRHSAATDWLKNGMHPKVASERLGHASVGITLDLYSHVTPTMQREAVEEIRRRRSARRERDGA
jgi:integrase